MKLLNLAIIFSAALFLTSCGSADPDQAAAPRPQADLPNVEPSIPSGEANPPGQPSDNTPAVEPVEPTQGKRVAVGHKAPSFQLKDQNGREHSLEDLLKDGNLAVVFYRSSDW